MADENNQNAVDNSAEGVVESAPQSDAPEWAKTLVETVTALRTDVDAVKGRQTLLGKDIGKVRQKAKAAVQDDGDQKPAGISREDLVAASQVGRIQAKLTEDASTAIDEMVEDGVPYSDILRFAKLAQTMSAPPENGGNNTNGDRARSPKPPTRTPDYPKSKYEFVSLKLRGDQGDKAAAERYEKLKADPNFHPEDLPQILR